MSGATFANEDPGTRARAAVAAEFPMAAPAATKRLRASQLPPGAPSGGAVSQAAAGRQPSQVAVRNVPGPVVPLTIQRKPALSSVGDTDEREKPIREKTAPSVNRGAALDVRAGKPGALSCEGYAEQQLQRSGDGLRPSRIPAGGPLHPSITSVIGASRAGGGPLERTARERLERGLGESLEDVRVHADAHAGALARAVSARAFAVGSDLFFADGAYRPGSRDGDKLIAHEVTHAVQQRGDPASGPLSVSAPGDAAELEAEAMASTLEAEASARPTSAEGRQPGRMAEAPRVIHGAVISIARTVDPTSDDYQRGYNDGRAANPAAPGPLSPDALDNYNEGYQNGQAEAGAAQASLPPVTAAPGSTASPPPDSALDTTSQMSIPAKLVEAIRRGMQSEQLDKATIGQLKALLDPESLAIGILLWMASHYGGVGEVVDAITTLIEGLQIKAIIEDLWNYAKIAIAAQTSPELDRAGEYFANAVLAAGVAEFLSAIEELGGEREGGEAEKPREEQKQQAGDESGEPSASEVDDGVATDEDIHPEDSETEPANEPELDPALCFPAGTVVATPAGSRPIEQLCSGEQVWSFDQVLGQVIVATITSTLRGWTSRWVEVDIGATTLRATGAHRFWVESKQDWYRADDLLPGMMLLGRNGCILEIRGVSSHAVGSTGSDGGAGEATYNLSVAGTESYFVGDAAVLVHNNSDKISEWRFDRLSRKGYKNYVLKGLVGKTMKKYYSGYFGPGVPQSQVEARHARNHDRFNKSNGDQMIVDEEIREYGEARLKEHQDALDNDTIGPPSDDPDTYRCNRQNPASEDTLAEIKKYQARKANCG